MFSDEDRLNVITGLKCRVVPLDPVYGKMAREAHNPADRLKVTLDFFIGDETRQIRPGQNRFVAESLRLLSTEAPFQLIW